MKKILIVLVAVSACIFFGANYRSASKAQSIRTDVDPRNASFKESVKYQMFNGLIEKARQSGTVHVIVGLHADFRPEGNLIKTEQETQRLGIKRAQEDFLNRHQAFRGRNSVKQFEYIPYLAMEVDAASLRAMQTDSTISAIEEDVVGEPGLAESIPIVGADTAWNAGYTGSGQTVAILDSGVDKNHNFLSPRVISEGCYSSTNASSTSVCPGGETAGTTVSGAGLNCPSAVSGCDHGTNVAGIAAGKGAAFSGVAKDANIIAIQMFSQFTPTACGNAAGPSCARYWTSDLIRGLERVRTLANTMNNITAVNLSLQTGQQFVSNCNTEHAATKAAIDNLRSVNIATIICAGNFSFTNALTAPACISTSISVGSTDDGSLGTTGDAVSNFSDSSPLLHLLAPGRWINSSIPNNNYANYSGTSMATPHVVGAFAILKQRKPSATIDQMLNALINTGQPITDTRNGIVKPRIRIGNALQAIATKVPADFDGDGKTDLSIFRPAVGEWWYLKSSNGGNGAFQFGSASDKIVPADYTGDGKTDIAFFRPSTSEWYVMRSENQSFYSFPFGASTDVPAPADYDGDGKTDVAVYRPSETNWYIRRSSDNGTTIQQFGASGDVPVPADYDGDGKADIAIYRVSLGEWWILRSTAGLIAFQFGTSTDKPVQGDYTGDLKADVAFFRPSTNEWFVLRSENQSYYSFPFGASGDTPAPGDYDGDGKFDGTVYRSSTQTWYSQRTTAGTLIQGFGSAGDVPVPNAFVP
jgi:subtilisin